MTTSIRTSADGLSSIIAINGVDKMTIDQNGKVTATSFSGLGVLSTKAAINTTSGTAHDFTGIPAGVNMFVVSIQNVSTNGSGALSVQLGTAGGVVTTGYLSVSSYASSAGFTSASIYTTGFATYGDSAATNYRSGSIIFTRVSGNIWTAHGVISQVANSPVFTMPIAGHIDLGTELTTVRITTTTGDTFDNGIVGFICG